jgi:hypothetical protein
LNRLGAPARPIVPIGLLPWRAPAHKTQLDAALVKAMAWQRTRIRPNGEVEVAGNTRAGLGQEQMMGHPKGVNYREVTLAFMYFGMIHNDTEAIQLAQKVATCRP